MIAAGVLSEEPHGGWAEATYALHEAIVFLWANLGEEDLFQERHNLLCAQSAPTRVPRGFILLTEVEPYAGKAPYNERGTRGKGDEARLRIRTRNGGADSFYTGATA